MAIHFINQPCDFNFFDSEAADSTFPVSYLHRYLSRGQFEWYQSRSGNSDARSGESSARCTSSYSLLILCVLRVWDNVPSLFASLGALPFLHLTLSYPFGPSLLLSVGTYPYAVCAHCRWMTLEVSSSRMRPVRVVTNTLEPSTKNGTLVSFSLYRCLRRANGCQCTMGWYRSNTIDDP
jgi:hypothetical protein